jgi:hypothetical protein
MFTTFQLFLVFAFLACANASAFAARGKESSIVLSNDEMPKDFVVEITTDDDTARFFLDATRSTFNSSLFDDSQGLRGRCTTSMNVSALLHINCFLWPKHLFAIVFIRHEPPDLSRGRAFSC